MKLNAQAVFFIFLFLILVLNFALFIKRNKDYKKRYFENSINYKNRLIVEVIILILFAIFSITVITSNNEVFKKLTLMALFALAIVRHRLITLSKY